MRPLIHVLIMLGCVLPLEGSLAASVQLGGVVGNRAVLIVDGGRPQTLAPGAKTREGVVVVAVGADFAVIEIEGRRERIRLGDGPVAAGSAGGDAGGGDEVHLFPDSRGHYATSGLINGSRQQFLVDTGATFVSMGVEDARRAGINYMAGKPAISTTANGQVRIWVVRVDSVQIGDLVLRGVDAAVHESSLPVVLLGMSFLSRTEMRREGGALILKKAY